jgi:O-antigen/teichoic acid export membrane protein
MVFSKLVLSPKVKFVYDLLVGLALRGGGAVASFVVTWLIARQFGAAAVGQYQIGLTTATLGAMAATLGLHLVLVREAGRLITTDQWGDLAATYRACRKYVVAAGSVIIAAVLAATLFLAARVMEDTEIVPYIITFAPLVIALALLRLNSEVLRSLGEVWKSQSLEGVFYSGLTAVILASLWLSGIAYSAHVIAFIYAGSVAIALFLSARIISSKLAGWGGGAAHIGPTDGLAAVAPAVIMIGVDWVVLLIIGIFLSVTDAGIYRTLVMYGALIQMVTTSFAIMAGPHLARAKASENRRKFFAALNAASYLGIAVAALPVLAAVFIPDTILGLFGPDFVRGSHAMGILAVAQLVGVAAGPAAPAMIMLHREKPVLYVEVFASIASVPIAYVLVQHFGLIGPPIAVLWASVVRGVYTRWALARAWKAG